MHRAHPRLYLLRTKGNLPLVRSWPKAAPIRPFRMGPLTGEHRRRIRAPGRWSARPSLTRTGHAGCKN
jgi:hypothetical protein